MDKINIYLKHFILTVIIGIGFTLILGFSRMELYKFLSISSLAAIIAPVLSLLIICQLAPTTPTIYEKIISSNYKEAFMNLVESTKLDGTIAVCVYSYENNFVMTTLIEPLKKIIHLLEYYLQVGYIEMKILV